MVTEPMVSPFCNPLDAKAVDPEAPVSVAPKGLLTSFAVIVKVRVVILAVSEGCVTV